MNTTQKTYLRNWERVTKFQNAAGKKTALTTILDDLHKYHALDELALPDYMNRCHVWLYYNYIGDWSKLPKSHVPKGFDNGEQFGREVIRLWREECLKLKFFNSDILNVYQTFDQLTEVTDRLLGDGFVWKGGDCISFAEKLFEVRQAFLDEQSKKHDEELVQLEIEKDLAEAEANSKKAQEKAAELRRKKAEIEAERVRQQNKEMSARINNPWNNDVQTTQPKDDAPNDKPKTAMEAAFAKAKSNANSAEKEVKKESNIEELIKSFSLRCDELHHKYDVRIRFSISCITVVTASSFKNEFMFDINRDNNAKVFHDESLEVTLLKAHGYITEIITQENQNKLKLQRKAEIEAQMAALKKELEELK